MMRLRSENVAISYCMKKYQEVSLQINILGDTKLVKSVRAEKTSVWWRQSVGGGEGTRLLLPVWAVTDWRRMEQLLQ